MTSSAGKNDSIASSATVTSSGVPNVAMIEKKRTWRASVNCPLWSVGVD